MTSVERSESIMTWEIFGPKMIDIYAEAFSEDELRDLVAETSRVAAENSRAIREVREESERRWQSWQRQLQENREELFAFLDRSLVSRPVESGNESPEAGNTPSHEAETHREPWQDRALALLVGRGRDALGRIDVAACPAIRVPHGG